MITQPSFWDKTIDEAFWEFHTRNPGVYRELAQMTRLAKARGRKKVGIAMFFEVLRWNRIVAGLPDKTEDFKLNNNYRSRYARLLMKEPDLKGMFETRGLRAK